MKSADGAQSAHIVELRNTVPGLLPSSAGRLAQARHLTWLFRRILRQAPRSGAFWIAASVLGGVLAPVQLWATKGVGDNLQSHLEGASGTALWWFAGIWSAVIALTAMLTQAERALAATTRERGGAAIAAETLEKATRIDLAWLEYQAFYDRLALILTNAENKANDALQQLITIGSMAPRTIVWGTVLIAFDWRLALLAIVPQLPATWGWFFSGAAYWDVYHARTRDRRLADYYAALLTTRQAAKEIRLFGLGPTLIARWERLYWTTVCEIRNKGLRVGLMQRGLSQLTLTLQMLGLAWYISAAEQAPSAGTAMVVISSFMSFYFGFVSLGSAVQRLGEASGFAADVRSFLDLPNESDNRTRSVAAMPAASELRLDNVSFTYPGATCPTLRDISLVVRPGEKLALVGENGAGKSTLVKLMLGLYTPDRGRVLLDGTDIVTLDPDQVRSRLAGVFQQFIRYPFTARDNVLLDYQQTGDIDRALDLAGLPHLASRLSNGLDTVLSPDLGGEDLSGGQWQRIAIARASIRDASLLILDEPTAALDPLAEVAIYRRFAELARGRTTILVSHRLGMARLADRIIVLDDGHILEEGTHDELVTRPGSAYAAMWAAQARWYQ